MAIGQTPRCSCSNLGRAAYIGIGVTRGTEREPAGRIAPVTRDKCRTRNRPKRGIEESSGVTKSTHEEIGARVPEQNVSTFPTADAVVTGAAHRPNHDDLPNRIGAEYIAEVCFASYARQELQFRDRSLMNMALLIALNRAPELQIHIRAALHNDLSKEQICEACGHAMIYCGVPAGRDELGVASVVFSEVEQAEQNKKLV
ncbi:hypothetical protein NPX13_g273 [Xylaria arbuscula]|uniref:Carboxymuconolactone decarboxylase-like domain-containing protein n=1 Tax=Xylaria arbuscula TaxID=114810 RepID=A0A9W8NPK6_9PEZI|nr:hypothetical protein NPX13_g273 [Xylaria arbuscula]